MCTALKNVSFYECFPVYWIVLTSIMKKCPETESLDALSLPTLHASLIAMKCDQVQYGYRLNSGIKIDLALLYKNQIIFGAVVHTLPSGLVISSFAPCCRRL